MAGPVVPIGEQPAFLRNYQLPLLGLSLMHPAGHLPPRIVAFFDSWVLFSLPGIHYSAVTYHQTLSQARERLVLLLRFLEVGITQPVGGLRGLLFAVALVFLF